MKKVLSILLAVVMLLSFISIAGADEPGSITITKYRIPNDFILGAANDGREIDSIPAGTEALDGITFKITKMVSTDDPAAPGAIPYVDDGVTLYYVAAEGSAAFSEEKTTAGGGVALFDELPRGLYYVEELASPLVTDPCAPFFVSIPTYLDDNVELWDVFAYPKNEDLKIDKFVHVDDEDYKANGYAIGDDVTWRIEVDVPTDIAAAKKYDIVDVYSQGLRFNPASVVVKAVGGSTLSDTLYTVTPPSDTPDDDGGEFRISFHASTLDELAGIKKLSIFFETEVLDTAPLNEVMPNHAELQYQNRYFGEPGYMGGSEETTRTPGIDPVVFTGGIRIYKHDAVNENVALEGATFMLVPKTEDDFDDEPVKTSTIIATSGADGVVEFKGIAYGRPLRVDELAELATLGSEYWLVETAAPAGYRTPGGGWQVVTINISSWNALAEPLALTKVPNVKGFNFPMTGGMGTLAFILAGSALAAAAYGSHKMGRKERELA